PASDARLVAAARDKMLPDIAARLQKKGHRSYFYGNFSRDRKSWDTYPALPRFGIAYVGLRHRLAFLSESYAYASYKERVLASRDFVHSCLEYVAANKSQVLAVVNAAQEGAVEAGRRARADSKVALRFRPAPRKEPVTILGFEEEQKDGRRVPTARTKD